MLLPYFCFFPALALLLAYPSLLPACSWPAHGLLLACSWSAPVLLMVLPTPVWQSPSSSSAPFDFSRHGENRLLWLKPYINHILGPFLKLYNQYIDKYEEKKKKFTQATKTYKDFGILVEEFQAKPRSKGLTLLHHMLTPIQR